MIKSTTVKINIHAAVITFNWVGLGILAFSLLGFLLYNYTIWFGITVAAIAFCYAVWLVVSAIYLGVLNQLKEDERNGKG